MTDTTTVAFKQTDSVNNFLTFSFVGLEVITGIACAVILFFVNVEKTISKKHLALVEREKEACKKEGKEWLPSDERNAGEIERQEAEAEEIYKKELEEKCSKKGLNFEEEYKKHLDIVAFKKAKKDAKQKAAKEKEEKKLAMIESKKTDKTREKEKLREAKIEEMWAIEKIKGEKIYKKFQEELSSYNG